MINKDILERFKKMNKDKFNIDLTDEQATEMATHFFNLMRVITKPKPKRK